MLICLSELQTPDTSVERAIDKVLNFSQNSFAIFKSSQIEEKRRILNFSQNSFAIFKSSQIEEKRRILNIVFANFFMDGKNPEISMRKTFSLLSNLGGCQDWTN